MIKCIATDMDGTLLNSRQMISEGNRTAIKKAQEKGIEVVIATGRSYDEAQTVLAEAGLQCPIICVNGAEVRTKEGEIIHTNELSAKQSLDIYEILYHSDTYYEVFTNKGIYTDHYEKGVQTLMNIFQTANPDMPEDQIYEMAKNRYSKGHIQIVENYEHVIESNDQLVYKFLVVSKNPSELMRVKEKLEALPEISVSSSGSENLEVTHNKAQKGIALTWFTERMGISMQETMAIGDNLNDLSMFERVGRSVAMGNGHPDIKKICSHETAVNDEDGVGKAILEVL
ncbi:MULTISPECIES: Cof-type HAD-IIB family hydrolase [Bacillus]|uniref:Cof-type HAD-IIB family hydrolase n=1 Tax=Bacillus TaxID=1386 RepID=UPI00065E4EE3|nr:Cof-type HAD-IIB family hydrolase [Bacillus smithii]AKP48908.1 Hydrolase HAD superfamily [Bacillus smithii]MED4885335.1 Cof-type HAD-IIB family hydrolase [Bacillus smithii]MED4929072.1 Cof-type HAD-IIB family hydrolase [Bacillus smithii]